MYVRSLVAALLCGAVGCGGSGINPRPIETLMYVTGAQGTQFAFVSTPDATCAHVGSEPSYCQPSGCTGIQAPNADHQFGDRSGDRVFETPHLFVLENICQPVTAVLRNLDPTNSIQVNLFLGQTPQVLADQGVIGPGDCSAIVSAPQGSGCPNPQVAGPQVQVEVCSPIDPVTHQPNLNTSCLPPPTPGALPPQDRNIAYFATIGDLKASNITNCILSPILDACRTPTTFFLEQPQDQVDAVMSVNSGQNPGGDVPTAEVRLELYVGDPGVVAGPGDFVAFNAGTNPVVSKTF
jgi:hypothetical protein